jgi:hypothetical protein
MGEYLYIASACFSIFVFISLVCAFMLFAIIYAGRSE